MSSQGLQTHAVTTDDLWNISGKSLTYCCREENDIQLDFGFSIGIPYPEKMSNYGSRHK